MRFSDVISYYVDISFRGCYKTLNRGGTYVESFDWIKNNKATINTLNNNENVLSMQ